MRFVQMSDNENLQEANLQEDGGRGSGGRGDVEMAVDPSPSNPPSRSEFKEMMRVAFQAFESKFVLRLGSAPVAMTARDASPVLREDPSTRSTGTGPPDEKRESSPLVAGSAYVRDSAPQIAAEPSPRTGFCVVDVYKPRSRGFHAASDALRDLVDFGIVASTKSAWQESVEDQIERNPDEQNWWHRVPSWPQSVDFSDLASFLKSGKSAREVEKLLRRVVPQIPLFFKAVGRSKGFPSSYPSANTSGSSQFREDFPHTSLLGGHLVRKVIPELLFHPFQLQKSIEFARVCNHTAMEVDLQADFVGEDVAAARKSLDALLAGSSHLAQGIAAFTAAVQEDLVTMSFAGAVISTPRYTADVNSMPSVGGLEPLIQAHVDKCEKKRAARRDAPVVRVQNVRPSYGQSFNQSSSPFSRDFRPAPYQQSRGRPRGRGRGRGRGRRDFRSGARAVRQPLRRY